MSAPFLRQSTAATVEFGPFLSPSDGLTPQNSVTKPSAAADAGSSGARITKAGTSAGFTPSTWTNTSIGMYNVNLGTGDTDTVGRLKFVFVDAANYCYVEKEYVVLPQAIYDWLFGASSTAPVQVGTGTGQINPSGGKVPATLASTDVSGNVAADVQTIKGQAVTCAAGVTVSDHVGTAGASTAQTGDCYPRIGAPTGASIAADIQTRAATSALPANFSTLTISGGAVSATVADKTGFKLASDGVDAIVVESGVNLRQAAAINSAALAGVLSGAGTGTISIKGANVSTVRIQATTDGSGNRSAVTLTLPS